MSGHGIIKSLLSGFMLVAMTLTGILIGQKWAAHGGVIPSFLFSFPDAPLSHDDLLLVLKWFFGSHLLIFSGIAIHAGPNSFHDTRRTVLDLYGLIGGFGLTSFGLFLLSQIPFDPDFFASAFVATCLLLLLAQIIGTWKLQAHAALWRSPIALIRESLFSLKSMAGGLVVLSVLIPVITAAVYVTDRDFANAVTRLRVSLNSGPSGAWRFTDLYPGQRFLQPMLSRFAPNGDLYVLERRGHLYRLSSPEFDNKELMLDFSANVHIAEKENGAQGFDFHPEFDSGMQQVFIYYTDFTNPDIQVNKLSRFDLAHETAADRSASEFVLIAQNRGNDGFHNGGTVLFGPDGFLYLSLGEMSATGDHQTVERNLRGGIIRIDPRLQGPPVSHPIPKQPLDGTTQGYNIPADNPFVEKPDALQEFWALGLRNPFRMDFDPATGALWAGDVGSTTWEEVNIIKAGGNYQFPFIEGPTPEVEVNRPPKFVGSEIKPHYFYRHTAFDRAVIGGTVYRGEKHASLVGQYLFADNYSGKVWSLPAEGPAPETPTVITQVNQVAQRGITSINQTPAGDIVITTLGESNNPTGRVLRLVSEAEWDALGLQEEVPVTKAASISLKRAKALYGENCARCHGDSGAGNGPDAPDIDVPLPDFTSTAFHNTRSEADLREMIVKGGDALGKSYWMPPWEGILTEGEIDGLIKHIRRLDPSYNPPPGEPGHRH